MLKCPIKTNLRDAKLAGTPRGVEAVLFVFEEHDLVASTFVKDEIKKNGKNKCGSLKLSTDYYVPKEMDIICDRNFSSFKTSTGLKSQCDNCDFLRYGKIIVVNNNKVMKKLKNDLKERWPDFYDNQVSTVIVCQP
jgi:hypothetical protein